MVSEHKQTRTREKNLIIRTKASLVCQEFKDLDQSNGKFPSEIIRTAYGNNLRKAQLEGRIRKLRNDVFNLLEVFA